MALRLIYGARGPDSSDPIYALVNTLSWVIIIAAVAPALLTSGVTLIGVVVLALAVGTFYDLLLARRTALRRASCTLLGIVAGQKGKLGPDVVRVGAQDRGIVGRATRGLMSALAEGTPLATAIAKHPKALPREAVAYAAAGEVIGAEAAALGELARENDPTLEILWRSCLERFSYLASVLAMMALVFVFLMIKIIPQLRKIFDEFELQLPTLTQWVIGSSEFIAYVLAPFLLVGVFVGIPAVLLIGVLYLYDIKLLQPLVDRFFRARRVGDVLRILALSAEYRHSFAPVLERVAVTYPTRFIRRATNRVTQEVSSGGDWRDALLAVRLIRRDEHALLGTAQEVGNLPWALRMIARRGERRLAYRWMALAQVIYPAVIVLLGGGVGIFVVAMFLPLVKLVQGLA